MIFNEILELAGEESKYSNHMVDTVVAADNRLSKLEEETGKKYPEVIDEYEAKVAASKKLDEEHAKKLADNRQLEQKGLEIKKKNTDAKREKRRILKDSRLTESDVAAFNDTRNSLAKFGYTFEDMKTLAKHISFIKNSECTPKEFSSMVKKYSSIKEAVEAANEALQETQLKLQLAKNDEERTRQASCNEQKRSKENKVAANLWEERAKHFAQTAVWWEDRLNKINWAIQLQQIYHSAIIEQIIKDQKMNPETAARYRDLKKMDLIDQTLQEYTNAFVSITGRKIEEFLSKINPQQTRRYQANAGMCLDEKI
jgi:hypothetical protein